MHSIYLFLACTTPELPPVFNEGGGTVYEAGEEQTEEQEQQDSQDEVDDTGGEVEDTGEIQRGKAIDSLKRYFSDLLGFHVDQ